MRTECLRSALLATLLMISLMATAMSFLQITPASAVPEGLVPRAPIRIVGNESFTLVNGVVAGSGTADDPYIIESWDISAENANGIEIRNTTTHFVIRNCYIHDGKDNDMNGIHFGNVTNGRIENLVLENNYLGITLASTENSWIKNCTCSHNGNGIRLEYSDNNTLENNSCSNNEIGIFLGYLGNNTLKNNSCSSNSYSGILLFSSSSNVLSNNACSINYRSIYLTSYSPNNTLDNNVCSNSDYGILLDGFSDNNTLINNSCFNNTEYGIDLYYSPNNILDNNSCSNNEYGIRLSGSNNNRIYHNNLINNTNQASDDGTNYWDDGYPSGGNYWNDYTGSDADGDGIGGTPYAIPGDNNQDRYPLMSPFVPEEIPPEEAPTRWPLIAGIVVIAIIGIVAALYMIRRKPTGFRW